MFILKYINKPSYEEEWPGIWISCLITFSCSSLHISLILLNHGQRMETLIDVNIDKVVSIMPGQTSAAHLGAIILWSIRCQLFNLAGSSVSDQYSAAAMRVHTRRPVSSLVAAGAKWGQCGQFCSGLQIWSSVHGASFWPCFHQPHHCCPNIIKIDKFSEEYLK